MPVLRAPSGARVVVRSEERAAALGWPVVEPEQAKPKAPKTRRTRKATPKTETDSD